MNDYLLDLGSLGLGLVFFAGLYFLQKRKVNFGIRTLIATAFGIVLGLIFPGHFQYIAAFGTVYAHVISSIVIPLLIFSIIGSLTNLGDSIRLKNIGLKTIFFLLLNTFTASVLTLVASLLTKVGSGFVYAAPEEVSAAEVPTVIDTLVSLFPQNLANHWVNGQVVPIVLFIVLVGIAYNKVAAKDAELVKPFKQFIDAGNAVMGKVVSIVIGFTPYAVLSLIARQVSRSSLAELLPLISVLILVYILCGVQLFIVHGTLLKVIGHLNPVRFFKNL